MPAQPPQADPPSTPPAAAWWCACYSRVGPTPATACRRALADCKRLERKAQVGGGGSIVPGSLTHACREVVAEHPGDRLGTREQWQPSERPGAWVSIGACLLPGPPDAPTAPTAEVDEPPSILAGEKLGELKIGLPATAVEQQLGAPSKRTRPQMSEATGSFVQLWGWPAKGLEVTLDAAEKKGPYSVAAIRATAPCALRTARGVGLGDPATAVEAAYLKDRDPDTEPDELSFVAGSIYSGVIFTYDPKLKTVTEIFLGAAAE